MTRIVTMACVLAGVAGSAMATQVEFRLVERRGQTAWNSGQPTSVPLNDNILNLAVQARVVNGGQDEALGNFGFDITTNEAQTDGTLNYARISNLDGTYNTGATQYASTLGSVVGQSGLATGYAYLAGINPNFNGLINASGGSFTDNPAIHEIGLVTGSPTGNSLLLITDTMGAGAPDTYPGTGSTAPLDHALADQYFAADGNWIDVYHFNYTILSNAIRQIHFNLNNAQAQTFNGLALANGVWGPNSPTNATTTSAGVDISVTPAPGAAALLGLGGLVAARRRRN
jgi:MYXO-CTERM domain-containing protein